MRALMDEQSHLSSNNAALPAAKAGPGASGTARQDRAPGRLGSRLPLRLGLGTARNRHGAGTGHTGRYQELSERRDFADLVAAITDRAHDGVRATTRRCFS